MLIKLFVPEENEVIYQVYRCRVPGPLKNIIYCENQFCSAAHAPLSLRLSVVSQMLITMLLPPLPLTSCLPCKHQPRYVMLPYTTRKLLPRCLVCQ